MIETGAERHLDELQALRLIHDDLDDTSARALREHVEVCPQCEEYLARLRAEREEWSSRPVPSWLPTSSPPRRAARGRWRVAIPIAATIAAVGAWAARDRPPEAPALESTRVKGAVDALVFEVYALSPGAASARRLRSGDTVSPGDRLGFKLGSERAGREVLVVGIDQAGEVYVAHPRARGMSAPLVYSGGELQDASGAIRLDHVLGKERLVAVLCERSFELDDYRSTLVRTPFESPLPELLPGCTQREVTLVKSVRQSP